MNAPLNALDQLPSGLTLAALRERAVTFGGNGCEVPAPDLLCLLDALDEARRAVDDAHTYHADGFEAAVAECEARQAVRDAELAKLREQLAAVAETVADLRSRMACDSRDWAADRRDAWLYGVIVGWDCDESHDHDWVCDDTAAMDEMAAQWGWNKAELRKQHAALTFGGTS